MCMHPQSCLILCGSMDCSLPGSSVHGISQARIPQEWVAISCIFMLSCFSCAQFFATPWTAAYQASPSMGFSRQEHWSELPFPPPMHESGKWKSSRSVVSDSEQPHGLQPTRLLHPWNFQGNSTGVGVPLPSPEMWQLDHKECWALKKWCFLWCWRILLRVP